MNDEHNTIPKVLGVGVTSFLTYHRNSMKPFVSRIGMSSAIAAGGCLLLFPGMKNYISEEMPSPCIALPIHNCFFLFFTKLINYLQKIYILMVLESIPDFVPNVSFLDKIKLL